MEQQDERHKTIWDFQREIAKVYEENKIRGLAGLNNEYILNERELMPWFFGVLEKRNGLFSNVDFHRLFDDIMFCSDEMLHFTGLLYLYRPYLQNPIKDSYRFYNDIIYPYSLTIEVRRYDMFSHTACEKVYNYWDRIGDLLAIFFPDKFKGKVYFGTSIDSIPEPFNLSDNYKWLKAFKDSEFSIMNSKRINIVHYETFSTRFKYQHIKNVTNGNEIQKLFDERNGYPEYFKQHLEYSFEGFERTVMLIEEILTHKDD